MTAGILAYVAGGHGGRRDGSGAKPKENKKIPITAKLSPEVHAKLMRLTLAFGGPDTRGAITAALEKAILDAKEP